MTDPRRDGTGEASLPKPVGARKSIRSQPSYSGGNNRWRRNLGRVGVHLGMAIVLIVWVTPILGLISTAFRPLHDVKSTGWWDIFTTQNLTLENMKQAFDQADMGGAILNSLSITLPANVGLVSMATLTAYAISKMKFAGRATVFLLIITMMAMPPQITLAPIFKLFSFLHLTNQIPSVWIFQAGFTMPLGILIMTAFFDELPNELLEAAQVDGASEVDTFLRVALPLSVPGVVSIFILHFIFSWNDLLIPLMLLRQPKAPVTMRIAALMVQNASDTTAMIAAAALVSLVIPAIVFFGFQRSFVRGLTRGAVKG